MKINENRVAGQRTLFPFNKGMTDKQGYNPNFSKYFNKSLLVRINDDRQIGGRVAHVDHFMNMVLDDAFELDRKSGTKTPLNKTIIRGSNIVFWEFLEKVNLEYDRR